VNRILNGIASDLKKETEIRSERGPGLLQYWESMKLRRREAALSTINVEKIAGYRERLRDQALNTTVCILISQTFTYLSPMTGSYRNTTDRRFQPDSEAVDGTCPSKTLVFSRIIGVQDIELSLAAVSSSQKVAFKPRPPLVNGFVGRADILEAMRHTHFEDLSSRRNMPKVTVLTGLGGSGKTQIALKFASEFEER
jgi:hypothetical protein